MATNYINAQNPIQMGAGESLLLTANFTEALDGDTLSSVTSITQIDSNTALTIGTGSVNTGGTVTVDGQVIAIRKAVQFRVTVPSDAVAGDYELKMIVATTGGNTRRHDVLLEIVT